MNKIIGIILLVFIVTGCSIKPFEYDLTTTKVFPPIKMTKNIPNLKVIDFEYTPHINISQNTISLLGCLPCQSDGGTPGFVYAHPIKNIIKVEVVKALEEVMLPSKNPGCTLGATINNVSWNNMTGNFIVDSIFRVKLDNEIKFIKRIQGKYNSSLFERSKMNRFLAKPSRKSVELLVNDESFLEVVNTNCK